MREIIDRALIGYKGTAGLNAVQVLQSRERVTQYVSKLISAGQTDSDQLMECALAYLKEMHEGRDPRFSGC